MFSANSILVSFGELMLRLDCPAGKRLQRTDSLRPFFGGSEANLSVLLSQLGIAVRFVSAFPDNAISQAAIDFLKSVGTDTRFVLQRGDRIGIYFTENGNGIRPSKVIYDRSHSAFSELMPGMIDWNAVFDGASWFHWSGITPALTKNTAAVCKEALQIAKQHGMRISADMNYRSTLWKYGTLPSAIMPELLSYCDVINGDINTAETYFGIKTDKDTSLEHKFCVCTERLLQQLPSLQVLAMSFRGINDYHQSTYQAGLWANKEFSFTPAYIIPQIVDRIGSGDAFMSGLVYSILKNKSPKQAITEN